MPMSIACHLRKHANQLGVGPGKKVCRSFLISDGLSSETPAHSAQDRRALDDLDRVATKECQVWVLAQDADRVVMGIGLDNRVRNLGVLELLDAVGGHSTLPEQWGTGIDQSRSMGSCPGRPGRHEVGLLLLGQPNPVDVAGRAVEDREKSGHTNTIGVGASRCAATR